ncbi:MAG: LON peptidase substrate-binding domain-containing protein [Pirellulales bacterium]|nr:LON peptidase substrate-binding domain-containing protein [Pirellulales bacterium]
MSAFEDYKFAPAEFAGMVRLFPIPNLVMFPHVMQPLHVFEPRYCDLLDDALQDDRFITLAVLAPGWESDYEACPRLQPFGCLAKIVISQPLDDGTHNLLLAGLRRVCLLSELPPTKTYREAMAMVCEDMYPPDGADQRISLTRDLHEQLSELLPQLPYAREELEQLLNTRMSLGVLTDVLGYSLNLELADRVTLLSEANVHRRAELLLGHLKAARSDCRSNAPGLACFPPAFSDN